MCSVLISKPLSISLLFYCLFIWSSFLFCICYSLALKLRKLQFFPPSSGMFCCVCLNKISWPRKTRCLRNALLAPLYTCQGQRTPEEPPVECVRLAGWKVEEAAQNMGSAPGASSDKLGYKTHGSLPWAPFRKTDFQFSVYSKSW